MKGIVVANPHGDLVIEGTKTLIVKDSTLAKDLGAEVVLIQGGAALGIIKLKTREPLYRDDFEKREKEHRISSNERRRWWPNVDKLWGYSFEIVEAFETPKMIFREKSERTRVAEVVYKDDDYYAAIKSMFSVEPSDYKPEQLGLVHRLLHSFYSKRRDGDRVVVEKRDRSISDIVERHSVIVGELKARGFNHDGPDDDLNSMSRPFEAVATAVTKTEASK